MSGLWVLAAICKWVGIVLLAILLLLLLLILLVLFLPIGYRAEVKKETELSGSFGVSLFLGAVRCRGGFDPENGLKIKLKLLWPTLFGGEPKERKKRKKKDAPEEKPAEPQPIAAREKAAAEEPPKPEKTIESEKLPEPEKTVEPEKPPEPPKTQRVERQGKAFRRVKLEEIAEPEPPLPEPEIPDEDEAFFTGEGGEEKSRGIPPVVSEILHIEDKKKIFSALGKLLKRLLKGVLPGSLFVKGTFGTGDPTTTGYLLAAAGIMKARFGDNIQIKGDFAKAAAEDVQVRIKGRIVPAYLLWAVLAFVLAKPVRRALWRLWKARKK